MCHTSTQMRGPFNWRSRRISDATPGSPQRSPFSGDNHTWCRMRLPRIAACSVFSYAFSRALPVHCACQLSGFVMAALPCSACKLDRKLWRAACRYRFFFWKLSTLTYLLLSHFRLARSWRTLRTRVPNIDFQERSQAAVMKKTCKHPASALGHLGG